MTLTLAIFWIIVVSSFALLAAYYAKRANRPDAIIALYVTLVIFANLTAIKPISFNLGFTSVFAPAAVLIFAVTFLLTDVVNEKFGRKETQKMILIALLCQIAVSLFSVLIVRSTPAPFFAGQTAISTVLTGLPRVIIASLIAFYLSETADAYIFAWFKKLTGGKHLWMRNVLSSLPAMLLDSIIFISLAFYGQMPLIPLILGQTAIKWLVGVIDVPFMYVSRHILNTNTLKQLT